MKLYFSPGACSFAPHIILEELQIPYQLDKVDLQEKTCSSGNFLQVNPKGAVPVLKLDNGEILTEVAVILQYLADQKPDFHFLPQRGSWDCYRCLEWLNYISSEMHKGFSPLFSAHKMFADDRVMAEVFKKKVIGFLQEKFTFLNDQILTKTYLMGDQYTVADAYLFVVLNWCKNLKLDLNSWPSLVGFIERVKSRPATMKAMLLEGLV